MILLKNCHKEKLNHSVTVGLLLLVALQGVLALHRRIPRAYNRPDDHPVGVVSKKTDFQYDLYQEIGRGSKREALCKNCEAIHGMILKLKSPKKAEEGSLRPAYPCDDWEKESRTCWLDRNVGDTVTLVLAHSGASKPEVKWVQRFHNRDPKRSHKYTINPDDPPWNVVIGSSGRELRLSPVTEMDMDFNSFAASTADHRQTLTFRIRVVPIDLGPVYPGETLALNMESFVSLPSESVAYAWYAEKEGASLPSNMRRSASGNTLAVSELRKEQEGVVACAVYTNMGFMVAKKRFLIQNIAPNQVLMHGLPESIPRRRPPFSYRKKREDSTQNEKPSSISGYQRIESEQPNADSDTVDRQQEVSENSIQETLETTSASGVPNGNTAEDKYANNQATKNDALLESGKKSEVLVEVVRHPEAPDDRPEDEISKLIAKCHRGAQCSGHASCKKRLDEPSGFCKCFPNYYGNGISCWEDASLGKVPEQRREII